ncbi:signal peptidase I [Brachybacterium sp. EF45031]|uniref:signal peptidase I n=1 Tax=Brachybacterium sillae TaxID=2810536 RepID=UPI00217D315D|nr:signal peptidase I [Brachybacterium sillae]MCS6712322.1 signal peptidase I [Brachybacterium sillae]
MTARTARRRPSLLGAVAVVAVVALLAAWGIRELVAQPFTVPSGSMSPLLQRGDVILADRTARGRARPGDVVVVDGRGYLADADSGGHYWVKRVIGVGGQRITCCTADGRLMVDGRPLTEPYVPGGQRASDIDFDVEVPQGRVFLLGDDRANSTDSRHRLGAPGGGMVPEERVVGTVTRIVWPPARARSLPPIDSSR